MGTTHSQVMRGGAVGGGGGGALFSSFPVSLLLFPTYSLLSIFPPALSWGEVRKEEVEEED